MRRRRARKRPARAPPARRSCRDATARSAAGTPRAPPPHPHARWAAAEAPPAPVADAVSGANAGRSRVCRVTPRAPRGSCTRNVRAGWRYAAATCARCKHAVGSRACSAVRGPSPASIISTHAASSATPPAAAAPGGPMRAPCTDCAREKREDRACKCAAVPAHKNGARLGKKARAAPGGRSHAGSRGCGAHVGGGDACGVRHQNDAAAAGACHLVAAIRPWSALRARLALWPGAHAPRAWQRSRLRGPER